MENEKKRNRYADIVKGFLILIVVFRHIFQVAANDSGVDYVCNLMAVVEMPLFFSVSGYFGMPSIFQQQEIQVGNKVKKITRTYIIPFISYYLLFGVYFSNNINIVTDILRLVFDITLSLWYLFAVWMLNIFLILGICVANRFRKCSNNIKYMIMTTVFGFLLLILMLVGLKVGMSFLGIKLIIYYSIFYYMGYLFKCYQEKMLSFFWIKKELIVFVCSSLYICGAYRFKVMDVSDTILNVAIRAVLAIVAIIACLNYFYIIYKNNSCRMIETIGVNTLEIYYVHSFLLRILNIKPAEHLMSVAGITNTVILCVFVFVNCFIIVMIIKENKYLTYICFGKK